MSTAETNAELGATAARWCRTHVDLADLRSGRDDDPRPVMRARWRALADLGWAGLLLDGAGMGGVAAVQRELGRSLAVSPMLATGVLAASLVDDATAVALAHGAVVVAVAVPPTGAVEASEGRSGWELHGGARAVPMVAVADLLVVVADGPSGRAAFSTTAIADGLEVRHGMLLDGQPAADLRFTATAALAVADEERVAKAEQRGLLALAAAMAGGQRRALEITVEHLRSRRQFGVPIGALQALQHRVSDLLVEAELGDALVATAVAAHDTADPSGPALAHAAKARLSDAYRRTAEEGLQLHGGIGMTDEAEIGFHLKAAIVAEQLLGDGPHHRARFAAARGY